MPPSSPRGASSGRHDGSSTGLQAPRPEVPRAAGSSPVDRRSAPGISRSCPFLAPGTGRSRGPAAPPASSARAKPSDPASKRRAGSTHFGRYSHLWEPNPVLFRDPSVQAPMPLSAPPASSSRVLTLLGVWRRRGRHGGRSSSVNGAERDTVGRQLPAPEPGPEAWTLNSKGPHDSRENRLLSTTPAAQGRLQLMHQRTAGRKHRRAPGTQDGHQRGEGNCSFSCLPLTLPARLLQGLWPGFPRHWL